MTKAALALVFALLLPAFASATALVKGVEIYSWINAQGAMTYALLPGTNATKSTNQVLDAAMDFEHLIHALQRLPKGTTAVWLSGVNEGRLHGVGLNLAGPHREVLDLVALVAKQKSLVVNGPL